MGLLPKDKYLGGGTTPLYTGHTPTVSDRRTFSDADRCWKINDCSAVTFNVGNILLNNHNIGALVPFPKDKYLGGGTTPLRTGHTPTVHNEWIPFSYDRLNGDYCNTRQLLLDLNTSKREQAIQKETVFYLLCVAWSLSANTFSECNKLLILLDMFHNMLLNLFHNIP